MLEIGDYAKRISGIIPTAQDAIHLGQNATLASWALRAARGGAAGAGARVQRRARPRLAGGVARARARGRDGPSERLLLVQGLYSLCVHIPTSPFCTPEDAMPSDHRAVGHPQLTLVQQGVVVALTVLQQVSAYNNGVGRQPPMGWNSWCGHSLRLANCCHVSLRYVTQNLPTGALLVPGVHHLQYAISWALTRARLHKSEK
eukprot:COSAG02_NODE_12_length_58022_cov_242.077379_42_plen_202_part_00